LTVLAAGAVITQKLEQVKTGDNHYVFTLQQQAQGFDDFQVRLDPVVPDAFYQNKQLSGFTEVVGPPRLLMVTQTPEEIGALLPALQNEGLQVDVMTPDQLPDNLAQIANYKSVILANVSAIQMSAHRMQVLQSYVRDLGGGLVVIGGPTSYGPGGYFQTPLEDTLPVQMRIRDQKRVPSLLIVYVIDRSGSMAAVEPGNTVDDLELAKEATRRSFNLLSPNDRVGIVVFDDNSAHWLAPVQYVGDQKNLLNELGGLQAGGGDGTLVSLQEVEQAVPGDSATMKHVVLLSDGGDDPTGLVDAATQLYNKYGITLTSICVGADPSTYMKEMAQAGHGVYYDILHAADLPQVFSSDTVITTHSYIIEKQFNVQQTGDSPILNGITTWPPLLGYVATTAKDTAEQSAADRLAGNTPLVGRDRRQCWAEC